MNITKINFEALDDKSKANLIYNIKEHLEETTARYSFQQKILAQTLFIYRNYNFNKKLMEKLSMTVPKLFEDIIENIWIYLSKKYCDYEMKNLCEAIEAVVTYICVEDDENLDDEVWEKYEEEWNNPIYYNYCLDSIEATSYILDEISSEEISWFLLTDSIIMALIGNFISDFSLEDVFKKEDGGYTAKEYNRHDLEIFNTETFAKTFSMLQEDFRLAESFTKFSKDEILNLRKEYENKFIFDENQIEEIANQILKSGYKD